MAVTTTIEPNFDRKLEIVTASLPREHSNLLEKIPREDALTVMDYMISLNAEVNPSVNYRKDIIKCLTRFCHYKQLSYSKKQTSLKQLDRKDVLKFLDSLRKSETADPLQDVLYSFKSVLSTHGYYVKTFLQAKEALKHLVELKNPFSFYDLAIIDIRMPDINGIQFYQILKIMNKNIKVLFVSALDAAEETVSLFPEIMSDNIIRKPITQTYLLDKVQETINYK